MPSKLVATRCVSMWCRGGDRRARGTASKKYASASRGALTRLSRRLRLLRLGGDGGQQPGVVGAENVLVFDHQLVAGVHGIALGTRFDLECERVATGVSGDRLQPHESREAGNRAGIGVGLREWFIDLER